MTPRSGLSPERSCHLAAESLAAAEAAEAAALAALAQRRGGGVVGAAAARRLVADAGPTESAVPAVRDELALADGAAARVSPRRTPQ